MSTAEESTDDLLEASLRELRPRGPGDGSLEKRLAIASILKASGARGALPNLGRLQVKSRLGGGGMGVVYRAYDPELGRPVAVKLLRGWLQQEQRELMAAEARALAKLSHPNVVPVYEIVDQGDELYFVMEYVEGDTLRGWLDARPEAPWREVTRWFVQAGRGLIAAHDKGIVHRDFKPENALVGDDGRVRVVDFGLARPMSREADEEEVGGTYHYMAPEVLEGAPATERSDQFSFSRSLLDALKGRSAPAPVREALERGIATTADERHETLSKLVDLLDGAVRTGGHRARAILIERVDRLWLRGVLERSVGARGAVELQLRSRPEAVDSPWESWGVQELEVGSSGQIARALGESHNALLLLGPPGGGKTTVLLTLCRELWSAASMDPSAPVPVVLSLSTFHPKSTSAPSAQGSRLAKWVIDELVAKYGLPRRAVQQWLAEAEVALLLDGLDETAPELRGRVVQAINHFRASYPAPIAVTCRDSEYEALAEKLEFGGALALQPLDDASMDELVSDRDADLLRQRLASDESLREMLRNPLLLTLYASAGASDALSEAPGWERAYQRYVDHAFASVEPQERAQIERRIGFLARTMQRLSISDLWLEKLSFDWLQGASRGLGYTTGVLAVLLFGVGLNLAQVPLTGDPLASALTFGLGVSITSFAYTRGRIRPVERLRWSWRRALRLLPITTVCALLVGLAEALRVNFAANMVGAGITGAILGLVFALESGDEATRVQPNAGIRRSLYYALGVSTMFGVPVGLVFAFVVNPYITRPLIDVVEHTGNPKVVVGVAVGLFVFTALFLIYGGFTVLMHGVLRLWLAWRTPLPLRMIAMLDRAVEVGLMRRVGGGYVFLHRTLLDYFAKLEAPRPNQ